MCSRLKGRVVRTPCTDRSSDRFKNNLPAGADDTDRRDGIVAASGGNHALEVAWAAKSASVSAKVFMPRATDPLRVEGCRALGAQVELVDDISAAFAEMETAAAAEGRRGLHPFEGEHLTLGAATCGAEYVADRPDRDLFIVPVGGGGLLSGMSAVIHARMPEAEIYGVEPINADSMARSLAEGRPVTLDKVDTIADSLGAPHALPYSFGVAQENVTGMTQVSDDELRAAMRLLFDGLRLIAEPACAASLAIHNAVEGAGAASLAALMQEKDWMAGRLVALIASGGNVDTGWFRQVLEGTTPVPG